MNLYTSKNYREGIHFLIEREKARGAEVNFSRLSEAIRVQRPYFSKVMNGQADFNADQLYLLCHFFELAEEETDFLHLLLEYDRAAIKEKRDYLKSKIEKIQNKHLEIKKHMDSEEINPSSALYTQYYLNHYMQVVHMALLIKKYQNLEKLAHALSVSPEFIQDIVKRLEELGLVEYKNNRFHVTSRKIHLPKESPLLRPHQGVVRLQSMQRVQQKGMDPTQYAFSATFSGDEEIRQQIQQEFLKFIKTLQKYLAQGGTEEVYQLNFDLFSWTK